MIGIYCLEQYNIACNASDHATNTTEHSNDTYLSNSSLIADPWTVDPSYNSPLLRRASAARAPSTSSFYDITDHIATLTTTDLLCRFTHTGHGRALEFHRSAQLSIPAIRERVGALHIFLDGRTQEDRARAAVSLDLSGDHHAANARDNEVSRRFARTRRFSQLKC